MAVKRFGLVTEIKICVFLPLQVFIRQNLKQK